MIMGTEDTNIKSVTTVSRLPFIVLFSPLSSFFTILLNMFYVTVCNKNTKVCCMLFLKKIKVVFSDSKELSHLISDLFLLSELGLI